MAEKETFTEGPCPVCRAPALYQFDKKGTLFVMCDGRHPANQGCGARVYLGARNTARMKAEKATSERKGKGNGATEGKPAGGTGGDGPANDNGTGGGERKRAGGGWGLGEW